MSSPGVCPGHNPLEPHGGAPVWCGPCMHHLRGELDALPYLASCLQREVKNATSNSFEHVSGSKERPIHAREKYTFFIETIDGVLTEWASAVIEDRRLAATLPARQGPRISATKALLLIHFDWLIAEHPDSAASEAFGLEIRRIYHKARKLTRSDDVRPEPCNAVVCPKCDLMMLEHELDWQGRSTGYIACAGCETLLSAAEYERWLKMLAAPLRRRAA